MSKKRHSDLKLKWKLGKAWADYQEHKKNKKSLGYLSETTIRHKSKKKPYKCRKLKGDHNYEEVEMIVNENYDEKLEESWMMNHKAISTYRCSACGKKYVKIITK